MTSHAITVRLIIEEVAPSFDFDPDQVHKDLADKLWSEYLKNVEDYFPSLCLKHLEIDSHYQPIC